MREAHDFHTPNHARLEVSLCEPHMGINTDQPPHHDYPNHGVPLMSASNEKPRP